MRWQLNTCDSCGGKLGNHATSNCTRCLHLTISALLAQRDDLTTVLQSCLNSGTDVQRGIAFFQAQTMLDDLKKIPHENPFHDLEHGQTYTTLPATDEIIGVDVRTLKTTSFKKD